INLARRPFNAPLTTIGTTLTQSSGAGLYVDGAPGVTPGTTPVFIHSGYSRNQVATAMKLAMAGHLQPAATYPEAELNNVADPLIAMDLEALSWTDVANNTIQENTVNPLPHITILGSSTVATGTDFYRFVVPAGALTRRVIVDLDGTNPTFNSLIRIVDSNGATVTENLRGDTLDIGSNQISSYIDTTLAPGEYYLQIGTPPFAGGAAPGQIYTLHLSVEGHAINANGAADPLVVNPFLMKGSGDLVRIIGHYVTNQGPMGHTTFLPGDDFGGYYDTANTAQRGQNNFFEGFYIDDIIIGFAERGEMVTNAPAGSNFIDNPEINLRNNLNPYQDIQEG
ncbi:MAG: PPC domain-containing protein, partial [Planctomyces sp.]